MPGPDPQVFSERQMVSLHTARGVQLDQFPYDGEDAYTSMKWTRALREVSICDVTVPAGGTYASISDIQPWVQWMSVWDESARDLYWTGPVQWAQQGRNSMTIHAADPSAYLADTWCPLEKRWESADPSEIAEEIWRAAIDHHNLQTKVAQRPDPRGDRFSFQTKAEVEHCDDVINKLVDLGLYWTVVAGQPIMGPAPYEPIAALGEEHFVDGELSIIRDGRNTYNEILLRAADYKAKAYKPMAGQRLQQIVVRDSLMGVGNAEKAAEAAVRYSGAIRDAISVPSGATLHQSAPLHISKLIPSVRVNVEAMGLVSTMELEGITMTVTAEGSTLGVDLESVNDDLPELVKIQRQK